MICIWDELWRFQLIALRVHYTKKDVKKKRKKDVEAMKQKSVEEIRWLILYR